MASTLLYRRPMTFGGLRITGRGSSNFKVDMITPKTDAKRFADCVSNLIRRDTPNPIQAVPASPTDELERLAGLVERGFLTREEFDARKKQLLGL